MTNNWPDTPFDESMLEAGDIIIHCPDKELAVELFHILEENQLRWLGLESMNETNWIGNTTCYRVCQNRITYGNVECYSDPRFDEYTKCTFYGDDPKGFEVASDYELTALLGVKSSF